MTHMHARPQIAFCFVKFHAQTILNVVLLTFISAWDNYFRPMGHF